jgi:DNA-directed RNA polymerase specialized sigma subunit
VTSRTPIKSILDPDMPFASAARTQAVGADVPEEFHAWKQNPTPQTRTALLKKMSPVIDSAMTSYGMGNAGSILRSRAKLITLQAMGSYDPQRGKLRTHLLSHLRGLQRLSGQQQQIISLPERVAIERSQLVETEDRLRDALGRDPSDAEIADSTGISFKRLGYLRQAKPPTAEGTLTRTDDEGNLRSPNSTPVGERQFDAWANFIYHDLSPADQLVMDYSLGRNGAPRLPLTEIARRMGVTSGAVSQRAARIQTLLDERHTPIGGAGAR